MSQRKGTGLNTKPWPILVDHYKETYMEWSPRLKISDKEVGVLKHFYIASTVEVGDGFTNYLLGLGTNLNLANFAYFQANIYQRNNDGNVDDGQQITISWAVPIGPFDYDGFIDHVFATDDVRTNTNFTSRLKYDIGPRFGLKTRLFIGVEYVYWNSKIGIDGVDEHNLNWLVKYHF